jgi:3-methylcrotonyl-CoA carboxylase alpha subunit
LKRFVNGQEVDLGSAERVEVSVLHDRLLVRTSQGSASAAVAKRGETTYVSYRGRQFTIDKAASRTRSATAASSGQLRAPMPGQIVDVLVRQGDSVAKGERLLVLEAMKTQQPLTAPFDGIVKELPVDKGQQIGEGALLATIEPVAS